MNIGDRIKSHSGYGIVRAVEEGEVAITWYRRNTHLITSWYTPEELKKWGIAKEETA